ncbi:MAG: RNA polymerase sigma factor [Draconibacterium sp.]
MDKQTIILSDKRLWDRFLAGDSESFQLIYEKSIQDLFAYGNSFCQDEEVVKDCIHDLFIEIHSKRTKLGSTDKILPYLMVIFKRLLYRRLRKMQERRSLNIEQLPFVLDIGEETEPGKEDTFELLKTALGELTERQREAIHLRYISDLSYEELAKVMHLNYQTSRNLIFRAIQKLRVVLNESDVIVLFILFFSRIKK